MSERQGGSSSSSSLPAPEAPAAPLLKTVPDAPANANCSDQPRLETPIPYRGFASHNNQNSSSSSSSSSPRKKAQEEGSRPLFALLGQRLRGLFDLNATEFHRTLKRLEAQFRMLDAATERYNNNDHNNNNRKKIADTAENATTTKTTTTTSRDKHKKRHEDPREDPDHPINAMIPNLIADVHLAGRSLTDLSIARLSTLLIDRDRFGSILELWLNDNDVSDGGSRAIASYLKRPSCPLLELWLGRNRIGPEGAEALAAALEDNADGSELRCLGLYLNPIADRGAEALAGMMRRNHALTTLDVHGCSHYEGREGDDEVGITEQYAGGCGCKAFSPYDGNEYVAGVIARSDEIGGAGFVTDRRFADAVRAFSAFNRKDPTREQAIRGIESSEEEERAEAGNDETRSEGSAFLSELRGRPATERLTDAEKCRWKEWEWQRL